MMGNKSKAFILLFWSVGNMIIFSAILYIKFTISGYSFDTYLLSAIMIIWVIGQIQYAKPDFKNEKNKYNNHTNTS